MRASILLIAIVSIGLSVYAQKPVERNTETRVIIRDGGGGGGEKPLILLDGKVIEDMNSISPDRIASVDVLKGEGALKIYGSEGKNGVVFITTKGSKSDTILPGKKQISKTVTVHAIRKRDGSKDTTLVLSDSLTVNVNGEQIEVNGMPLDMPQGAIIKDLAIPHIEGLDGKMLFFDRGIDMNRDRNDAPKIGMTVQDIEEGKGVMVLSVVPASAASKTGVLADDRILAIDEKAVNDVDALKDAIEKARDKRSIMIHLQRGKKDMYLELVFPRALKKADL